MHVVVLRICTVLGELHQSLHDSPRKAAQLIQSALTLWRISWS
jgi:hypothetical protein